MIDENIKYIEHCLKFIKQEDKDIIGFMKEQLQRWQELKKFILKYKCFESPICRDELLGDKNND